MLAGNGPPFRVRHNGPEGAAVTTLAAADIVCHSIDDALHLLLDDKALAATLRP